VQLAIWADVDVPILVKGEICSRQSPIFTIRFVGDRDVGSDFLLIDNPIERLCRAIGCVGGLIRGFEIEALLRPLDHRLCGANLGLPIARVASI